MLKNVCKKAVFYTVHIQVPAILCDIGVVDICMNFQIRSLIQMPLSCWKVYFVGKCFIYAVPASKQNCKK